MRGVDTHLHTDMIVGNQRICYNKNILNTTLLYIMIMIIFIKYLL